MRGLERRSEKVLRGFERKNLRKDLEVSEKVLTFAPRNEIRNDRGCKRREVLKVLKKNLEKDLVVQKIILTFAPLSAEKQR